MKALGMALALLLLATMATAEVAPGEEAPHFTLERLDGGLVETEAFIGKQPTLLMFWASW